MPKKPITFSDNRRTCNFDLARIRPSRFSPPFIQVYLKFCTRGEDGTAFLMARATRYEFEGEIDRLVRELELLKREARKWFKRNPSK